MMRRLAAMAVGLLAGMATPAFATGPFQAKKPYSADITVGTNRPKAARLWVSADALRYQEQGSGTAVILRLDRNVAWVLTEQPQMAIEVPGDGLGLAFGPLLTGATGAAAEGLEKISGTEAKRYRVTVATASGAHFKGKVWAGADGVIWRVSGDGGLLGREGAVEIRTLKVSRSAPDPRLFRLPDGVTPLRVPPAAAQAILRGLTAE